MTVLGQQFVLFEALAAQTGLVMLWMALSGGFCVVVTAHITVRKEPQLCSCGVCCSARWPCW